MNNPIRTLSDEKFQEIYTNKKFRNEVAHAHTCLTANFKFKHKKTCSYPVEYIVTEEQIELAKKELERSKLETIEANKGNLLFTGMGWAKELGKGITNHRFRAYFKTDRDTKAFVEFSYVDTKDNPDCLHVDFAFFGEDCNKHRRNFEGSFVPKSLDTVLKIVNDSFGCSFKKAVIDNYDISPNDVISQAQS